MGCCKSIKDLDKQTFYNIPTLELPSKQETSPASAIIVKNASAELQVKKINLPKLDFSKLNVDKLDETKVQKYSLFRKKETIKKKLILEILDDKNEYNQKRFKINSKGVKNIRENQYIQKRSDGKVVVSFDEASADIHIPCINENEKTCFHIEFKKDINSFYITSPRLASGTFIKINKEIKILNNYIFTIGESNFLINCVFSDQISLQFLEGPKSGQKFTFSSDLSPIQIGSHEDCQIRIDDPEISEHQCKITYNKLDWYISDGNGHSESKNGTWIFIENQFEILNDLIFKNGPCLFKISLIENSTNQLNS